MKASDKRSQYQKILNALLAGQKLSTFVIFKRFRCVDGRKRLSEIGQKYTLKKEWKERNGKRFLQYSIPI